MKNNKKKVKIKKKKRNTLWNSLQHPEPIIFDERMEAIDKRSYIWGVRIYTIIIFLTCLLAPIAYPDLRNNIFSTFLFGVVVFTVFGKALYRCYYGILKADGNYDVRTTCFFMGLYSGSYLEPFEESISILWYIVTFMVGYMLFYLLCHIAYAQYLKSNDDDFNGHKKESSQAIGILCAVVLGIILIGPAVNMAINKYRITSTLTNEEVTALEHIQKAKDAYYALDTYKLECFYTISNKKVKPVYSNYTPSHSLYWYGSKGSFALVLDDNNSKNPIFQANYLEDHDSNKEWYIYHDGKWVSEMDYVPIPEKSGGVDETHAYLPFTAVIDIESDEVDEILIENNLYGQVYTVNFNQKFLTASEELKSSKKENHEKKAIAIYTINDFGVLIGYELKFLTYGNDLEKPIIRSTKYNLINANKEKIDGEIRDLVNGKFESYSKTDR